MDDRHHRALTDVAVRLARAIEACVTVSDLAHLDDVMTIEVRLRGSGALDVTVQRRAPGAHSPPQRVPLFGTVHAGAAAAAPAAASVLDAVEGDPN